MVDIGVLREDLAEEVVALLWKLESGGVDLRIGGGVSYSAVAGDRVGW